MKITDMKPILEAACPRVAYDHFTKGQSLPFIAYGEAKRGDIYADNTMYASVINGFVELYTDGKDEAMEDDVEAVFKTQHIPYGKEYEVYIKDEEMYLNRWIFSILKGD